MASGPYRSTYTNPARRGDAVQGAAERHPQPQQQQQQQQQPGLSRPTRRNPMAEQRHQRPVQPPAEEGGNWWPQRQQERGPAWQQQQQQQRWRQQPLDPVQDASPRPQHQRPAYHTPRNRAAFQQASVERAPGAAGLAKVPLGTSPKPWEQPGSGAEQRRPQRRRMGPGDGAPALSASEGAAPPDESPASAGGRVLQMAAKLSLAQLRELCKQGGLPASGTKAELARRILMHETGDSSNNS